jgi:hypothetical protein
MFYLMPPLRGQKNFMLKTYCPDSVSKSMMILRWLGRCTGGVYKNTLMMLTMEDNSSLRNTKARKDFFKAVLDGIPQLLSVLIPPRQDMNLTYLENIK